MQSFRMIAIGLASTSLLFVANLGKGETTPAGKERPRKTGWHTSFEAAQAEAKLLGKPLVVHFYADWCGPCQQMERSVLNQPAVVRCLGVDVVGVKLNADHHSGIMSRFGVSGLPTDVVVSPAGSVSNRYVGGSSESGYIDRLKREGAKYPSRSDVQLASKSDEKADRPAVAMPAATRAHLGLDGYSPVALSASQLWKKGVPEYASKHQGVTYHFASPEELELFQANPAKYTPRLLGCDPVILSQSGRAVRGKTVHGAMFRDSVFLMASEANRAEFLKNPAYYADKKFAVELDEIEQFVSR